MNGSKDFCSYIVDVLKSILLEIDYQILNISDEFTENNDKTLHNDISY
jgi:hypothetical protein